jgi:hypothetical protein
MVLNVPLRWYYLVPIADFGTAWVSMSREIKIGALRQSNWIGNATMAGRETPALGFLFVSLGRRLAIVNHGAWPFATSPRGDTA